MANMESQFREISAEDFERVLKMIILAPRPMTRFSIIRYFDPYGDGKSTRKYFNRTNYETTLSLRQVKNRIEKYNKNVGYYAELTLAKFDNRKKTIEKFRL